MNPCSSHLDHVCLDLFRLIGSGFQVLLALLIHLGTVDGKIDRRRALHTACSLRVV